jgi:hypothetical protein
VAVVSASGWRGMFGGGGYWGVWVLLGAVAFARIDRRTYSSLSEIMGEVGGVRVLYCW